MCRTSLPAHTEAQSTGGEFMSTHSDTYSRSSSRQAEVRTYLSSYVAHILNYRVILCSHFFVNVRYMNSPLKKVRGRSIAYKLLIGWY